ncbi:hypothetical protein RRG08_039797 [Elysia crispata]|uniref:Heme-binding protein 2 n=1 Tax=Elysia crispata TaxID=231223 RepID=A0AAE1AS15_9GAST|nr:hypothetical protein RRG08_039797 [Elysia crispata]
MLTSNEFISKQNSLVPFSAFYLTIIYLTCRPIPIIADHTVMGFTQTGGSLWGHHGQLPIDYTVGSGKLEVKEGRRVNEFHFRTTHLSRKDFKRKASSCFAAWLAGKYLISVSRGPNLTGNLFSVLESCRLSMTPRYLAKDIMSFSKVVTVLASCLVVSIAAAAVGSTAAKPHDVCHGLECPNFTVLNKTADWELRRYGPTKWASTNITAMYKDRVTGLMFSYLFLYITKENANHTKIDMTVPVVTKIIHGQGPNCESELIMHFMLPFDTWDNPIAPTNPAVTIQEWPAMDVYVRSFGGFAKDADYSDNLAKLSEDLTGSNFSIEDAFFFAAVYDGPYTFVNRHNEVWIQKK